MTPREPDRYEVKGDEVNRRCTHIFGATIGACPACVATALRQAADDALERAAQEYGSEDLANIKVYCRHVAQRLRELKSPAAAPAVETVRCMCPPGAVAESCPLRNDVQSICECRCHAAPPSEPAAQEKFQPASEQDSQNTSADAQVEGARSAGCQTPLRGTASGLSPSLLPRVLAALEDVDGGMNMGCASLAAELRVYIAADPERK